MLVESLLSDNIVWEEILLFNLASNDDPSERTVFPVTAAACLNSNHFT